MIMTPDFYSGLPKKRMAAGAIFFDESGRVLLVQPAYRTTWDIPGGVVELDESPLEACMREVQEEVGLCVPIGRLLVVEYNQYAEPEKTEALIFNFDGGTLSAEQIATIKPDPEEIADWRFFARDALPENIKPVVRQRLLRAFAQKQSPTNAYFENVPSPSGAKS